MKYFYQNGLYEYEKRRKKHAAVMDIRQCNKPKVVKETAMEMRVQSYVNQNELTTELNL